MKYSKLVELYSALSSTTKRLEKAEILSNFFKNNESENCEWTYLLLGRVFPDYDTRESGVSRQLVLKAISHSFGISQEEVNSSFSKLGDLGDVACHFALQGKQNSLFSKTLSVDEVLQNIRKMSDLEGKGTVGKKMDLIKNLYLSASSEETKYITRTILSDLRIGIAYSLVLDAICLAFFDGDKEVRRILEEKYLLSNDISQIAKVRSMKEIDKLGLIPGKPTQVMLPPKVTSISEAFEVCGRPAAFEHKYDGFRVVIHKNKGEVSLFTRKLENVTHQFPDVVKAVNSYVSGDSFILDSEVVGYDKKTGNYKPFEAISQRIRRKYNIGELVDKLPVEVNVFDILYFNGENVFDKTFVERRKIIEKIVKTKERVIRSSLMIITDDEKEAEKFYKKVLGEGEEGVMIKSLDKPYRFGRFVGYMVKLKPVINDIDLVITGAEWGTGKRAGWLSSYIVACKKGNEFLDIGKVSSGLKEKKEEGFSYEEMTELLLKNKVSENGTFVKVKPKVVVSITYQNMQPSPEYSSGFALRFPRITNYRPDRNTSDICSIEDIKKSFEKERRKTSSSGKNKPL